MVVVAAVTKMVPLVLLLELMAALVVVEYAKMLVGVMVRPDKVTMGVLGGQVPTHTPEVQGEALVLLVLLL